MNIVEAFLKFNKQTIIAFTGLSGSGKNKLAQFFSKLFNYKFIKLEDFYKDDYDKTIQLSNENIINWFDIYESIDWKRFNKYVNENKHDGLIIVGFGLPTNLIDFDIDYNIHIKISKKTLVENNKINDDNLEIMNKITIPLNIKIIEDSTIDKFVNANILTIDEQKNEIFDYLMSIIQKWLDEK